MSRTVTGARQLVHFMFAIGVPIATSKFLFDGSARGCCLKYTAARLKEYFFIEPSSGPGAENGIGLSLTGGGPPTGTARRR